MSAFNKAGDIGKDKTAALADTHNTKIGVKRCKRIIGDLRFGGGNGGKKS